MSLSILVVEDSLTVSGILESCLELEGYKVRLAASTEAALEALKASPPDLMLLDVNLPDIQGDTACRSLRECGSGSHFPILLVSSLERAELVAATKRSGADGCFPKEQPLEILATWVRHFHRVLVAGPPAAGLGAPEGAAVYLGLEPADVAAIRAVIDPTGRPSVEFPDLASAAAYLCFGQPTLVFASSRLPDLGARELPLLLRIRAGFHALPVVEVLPPTENVEEAARHQRESEATAVFVRPLDAAKVQQALQRALGGARSAAGDAESEAFLDLADELGSADPAARKTAVARLGQTGDARYVPGVASMLDDADGGVRAAALDALGTLGDPDAVEVILPFLAWGKPRPERLAALRALAGLGDPRAEKGLRGLLFEEDPEVVALAERALAALA